MTEMVNCRINRQFDIVLPKHRADRPEWYTDKGWEKERLESMHKHIGIGDVVYYVGAEEGEFPALCQIWAAKVVLFEPNPKVWPNIKAIWEANNLKKPATYQGFASNKTTEKLVWENSFPLCADSEVIGNHGFKELHSEGDHYDQIRIDDVYTSNNFVDPPTAICMDVEGSEWRVLEGAEKTLQQYHPKLWISVHPEFMFRIYEEYQYDLRKWIKDLGYKETILDYQHELHLFYEEDK